MELILSISIVALSALGVGAGLALGGRAPRARCGGGDCGGACAACPRKERRGGG